MDARRIVSRAKNCSAEACRSDEEIRLPAASLVVPTRNCAQTSKIVAPGWYELAGVDKTMFVDDEGDDRTPELVASLAAHPNVWTIFLRNFARPRVSESRNRGAARATNDLVLFCDDDMHIEPHYAQTCPRKLLEPNVGAEESDIR